MKTYRCSACGQKLTLSMNAWIWHRLLNHPQSTPRPSTERG